MTFERDSNMTTIEGTPWESLSFEEKNRVLYERQKQMLVEILEWPCRSTGMILSLSFSFLPA